MKIWIDDIRPAPDGWIWAHTYNEAMELISKAKEIEEISFDHDLGEVLSGYSILCQIEQSVATGFWNKNIPVFHIHSANPVGRSNMKRAIESINRLALRSQM